MKEYNPGERVFYSQDGGSCVAEVLENNSNSEFHKYRLKVVQPQRGFNPIAVVGGKSGFEEGEEFNFEVRRGFENFQGIGIMKKLGKGLLEERIRTRLVSR